MERLAQVREHYYEAVFDTDRDRAFQVVNAAVLEGTTPEQIVFEVVVPAIDRMLRAVGVDGEATISQHFIAARVAAEVTEQMLPRFAVQPGPKGVVVLGTSIGDYHGLGKRIVGGCLHAHLFTVHDLGLNVSPERFVDEAVRLGASVIGVSSMMYHTATGEQGPRGARRLLAARGLESRVKLIVGGAPYRFDPGLHAEVLADGWADNAMAAAEVVTALAQGASHD